MRDPKYSTTDRNWVRPRVNDRGNGILLMHTTINHLSLSGRLCRRTWSEPPSWFDLVELLLLYSILRTNERINEWRYKQFASNNQVSNNIIRKYLKLLIIIRYYYNNNSYYILEYLASVLIGFGRYATAYARHTLNRTPTQPTICSPSLPSLVLGSSEQLKFLKAAAAHPW